MYDTLDFPPVRPRSSMPRLLSTASLAIAACVAASTLVACGTTGQASSELDQAESASQAFGVEGMELLQDPEFSAAFAAFYGPGGHKFTTFCMARAAGFSKERSYVLSTYSQEPDDQAWMNATSFSNIVTAFGSKTIALKNILHSLHGGNPGAVETRRSAIEGLIEKKLASMDPRTDWEVGLLVHAYGDAYAHTDENGDAYSPGIGHLLHWHGPDDIYNDIDKYMLYAGNLYELFRAVGGGPKDPAMLVQLKNLLRAQSTGDTSADELLAFYAFKKYGFNEEEYQAAHQGISKDGIRALIREFGLAIGVKYSD